jgi:hypothetical protein
MSNKKRKHPTSRLYQPLAIIALLSAGILQPILPVLAAGTLGGTPISNTATATFDDPNGGSTPISVESNTVTITVAEVAGISVTHAGFNDVNGSSVTTDDILYYDFRVANSGNDATGIYLPAPTIVGATINSYTIINPATDAVIATLPNTGGSTISLSGLSNGGILLADEFYTVRVNVTVTASNVGNPVTVTLGDGTGVAEGSPNPEVRTVDSPSTYTGSGEASTAAPVNDEQEGTATYSVSIGVVPKNKAFATILKTNNTPSSQLNNTSTSADDTIRYGLQLKVDSSAPTGTTGYTITDLQPVESVKFSVSKNGTVSVPNKNVVIMSDAIPTSTRLAVPTDAGYSAPVVPSDGSGIIWKVWYAYDSTINSTNVAGNSPLEEVWTEQAPANATEAATVKRIAFVKEGAVAKGVTTTTATFSVVTTGIAMGGPVYNIAQVVGQSDSGTNKPLVYDESGDSNPSNFDGSNAGANSDLTLSLFNNDATVTGIVTDTASPNSDPGNNTGTGTGGENNVVTIAAPVVAGLLNGPNGAPSATGTTDSQDDFTNKTINGVSGDQSTSIALTSDPSAITFNNTVASSVNLNNVVLRPIDAATAKAVDSVAGNDASYDVSAAIPSGTEVTITATVAGVIRTATYTYTSGAFNLASSTTATVTDGTATPIIFANFNGGVSVDYQVSVNLPLTGTQSLKGYSIPIVAYVEGDGPGQSGYGDLNLSGNKDQSPNVTIDRLYTGFMKVNKEVRVLDVNGDSISDPLRPAISTFTATPTASSQPKSNEILEYRITYQNIATAPVAGSGSTTLSAANFNVVEDGLTPNTWAGVTTHVLSKAEGTLGNVAFYNSAIVVANPGTGASEATSNTGYVNKVGTVAPTITGNFTFQRKLN